MASSDVRDLHIFLSYSCDTETQAFYKDLLQPEWSQYKSNNLKKAKIKFF